MDFYHGLLLITSIHLLAAASPGPDFVLVSGQTLTKGKKVGLYCSLGITLGLGVHILYSVLGLATVIAHSTWLLTLIKIIGGSYLIYLGWQGIRSKPQALTNQATNQATMDTNTAPITSNLASDNSVLKNTPSVSAISSVKQGFFCNVLNPKAPIYFVSLFTLVLSPDMPLWQLSFYGVWIMVLQMAWFSTVVMLLSIPSINRSFQRHAHWVDRVMGTAMAGLGLNLLLRR